jgi:hypothetical protein
LKLERLPHLEAGKITSPWKLERVLPLEAGKITSPGSGKDYLSWKLERFLPWKLERLPLLEAWKESPGGIHSI